MVGYLFVICEPRSLARPLVLEPELLIQNCGAQTDSGVGEPYPNEYASQKAAARNSAAEKARGEGPTEPGEDRRLEPHVQK